jgi:anti-anti-sigma regulatory factor
VTGEIDLGAASAVRSRRRFDRSGGSFAIASPNRTLLKVLEITQLDRHFAIYPSRTAALDGDGNH